MATYNYINKYAVLCHHGYEMIFIILLSFNGRAISYLSQSAVNKYMVYQTGDISPLSHIRYRVQQEYIL